MNNRSNNNNKKLCGICNEKPANYKCPKCGVPYCSLACYKDETKHVHNLEPETTNTSEKNDEELPKPKEKTTLLSENLNEIYESTPELKDLLQYNTVKFHLNKVYRILTADSSGDLNTESKKQLASDYLNTLRYGGIHYNEAIEEFCQITLAKLESD
ncbi:hypothetical protein MOUN0_N11782 [Monosporozyma unispora]|nr:HIT domain protein [Kazachstania unispora]